MEAEVARIEIDSPISLRPGPLFFQTIGRQLNFRKHWNRSQVFKGDEVAKEGRTHFFRIIFC